MTSTHLIKMFNGMLLKWTGVVARVESLRGRNSPFKAREAGRQVEELFESLLAQSFDA
jgi:hypothetical protein